VHVVPTLRAAPRIVGVPLGGTSTLRLSLPSPASSALGIQLSVVNPSVATVPATATIPAGATEVVVPVTGLTAGATTIVATSSRGNTWAIASVSAPVPKTMSADASLVGTMVVPARLLGRIVTPIGDQRTLTLQLLSTAAVAGIPVTITSTNPAVAFVAGGVTIAPGSRSATVTVVTGQPGTATLTLRAGNDISQITVVVGAVDPALAPPTFTAPVGFVVIPAPTVGRIVTPAAAQSALLLQLLSTGAAADTIVTVTSSDPNIANVVGPLVIPAGSRTANVTVATGSNGTATLTFHAGAETRSLTVVVGPPAPGTEPPILASPVGVTAIEQRRLGTVISAPGGQPAVNVSLLSNPAVSATQVTVSSSNPNVAIVNGTVSIPAGSRIAALDILTGSAGVATLTLRAGNDIAQLVIVVGTPPASLMPVITAPLIGVQVKQ
jgi:hypothetical protein